MFLCEKRKYKVLYTRSTRLISYRSGDQSATPYGLLHTPKNGSIPKFQCCSVRIRRCLYTTRKGSFGSPRRSIGGSSGSKSAPISKPRTYPISYSCTLYQANVSGGRYSYRSYSCTSYCSLQIRGDSGLIRSFRSSMGILRDIEWKKLKIGLPVTIYGRFRQARIRRELYILVQDRTRYLIRGAYIARSATQSGICSLDRKRPSYLSLLKYR